MWLCRKVPVIRRVAAFWTACNRRIRHSSDSEQETVAVVQHSSSDDMNAWTITLAKEPCLVVHRSIGQPKPQKSFFGRRVSSVSGPPENGHTLNNFVTLALTGSLRRERASAIQLARSLLHVRRRREDGGMPLIRLYTGLPWRSAATNDNSLTEINKKNLDFL